MEIASQCFGIEEDFLVDCVADTSENIRTITELFKRDGAFMILIQFQEDDSPSMSKMMSFLRKCFYIF